MWQDVLALDELRTGQQLCRTVGRCKLLLLRTDESVYAMDNQCPHAAFPLKGGVVESGFIRCPMHGARFNLESGEVLGSGRIGPLPTYPVRVSNGRILVEIEE